MIYTYSDCVERVGRIIAGNYITPEARARIWLFLKDILNQLSDRCTAISKTSTSMAVGSAVQTFSLPVTMFRPIQVYCLTSGGTRVDVEVVSDGDWGQRVSTQTKATYPAMCRVYGVDSEKTKQLQISPMFSSASTLYIDYLKYFPEPYEYQTGTATATIDSAGVTGVSTQWVDFAAAKDYFRVDSVGKWYQIASITNDTALVLTSPGYLTATKTAVNYTISNFVMLPEQGVLALIYGVASQMLNISGQKELAAGYWQMYQDAVARLTASETPRTEETFNCYQQ